MRSRTTKRLDQLEPEYRLFAAIVEQARRDASDDWGVPLKDRIEAAEFLGEIREVWRVQ